MKVPKYIEQYYPYGLLCSREENYIKENELRIRCNSESQRLEIITNFKAPSRLSDIKILESSFTDISIDWREPVSENFLKKTESNLNKLISIFKERNLLKHTDWEVNYEWY